MQLGSSESSASVVMKPTIEIRDRAVPKILPLWRVLLHNDDQNNMDYVVRVLRECVAGLSEIDAQCIMLEAHMHGLSEVVVEPLEAAEFHHERLVWFGLVCTIEPAD